MTTLKRFLQHSYWTLQDLEPGPLRRWRSRRRRLESGERIPPEILDKVAHDASQRPERAIVSRARADSDALFIVFEDRGLGRQLDPTEFILKSGLIRTNLVMLRDHYRFFYHAGLSTSIPDVASILARLRAVRDRMAHVRRTYCLGSSAGGYAAILFGHHLGVDACYAFAPQSLLDLRLLTELTGRDHRGLFPAEHRDLARLLRDHNGHSRFEIYYSEGNSCDRQSAKRLRRCPAVRLHAQPGNAHMLMNNMLSDGSLREVLGIPAAAPPDSARA